MLNFGGGVIYCLLKNRSLIPRVISQTLFAKGSNQILSFNFQHLNISSFRFTVLSHLKMFPIMFQPISKSLSINTLCIQYLIIWWYVSYPLAISTNQYQPSQKPKVKYERYYHFCKNQQHQPIESCLRILPAQCKIGPLANTSRLITPLSHWFRPFIRAP